MPIRRKRKAWWKVSIGMRSYRVHANDRGHAAVLTFRTAINRGDIKNRPPRDEDGSWWKDVSVSFLGY